MATTGAGADPRRLIGRQRELGRLLVLFDAVAAGRGGGLVMLSGEPGIGKSVLAGAAAALAADRGLIVATGRCRETEGAPPFRPWTEILGQLVDVERDAVLHTLDRGDPTGAGDRFRPYEAATRTLERATATRPALIVLDDLHRADEASIALLRGCYRSTEVTTGHPLHQMLGEAYRHAHLGGQRRARHGEGRIRHPDDQHHRQRRP